MMRAIRGALFVSLLLVPAPGFAQAPPGSPAPQTVRDERRDSAGARAALFIGGAAVALVAHEGGHLVFNVAFDADPFLRRVEFHGIPFFALTHRRQLSPRREAIVSSAGFWVQHATSEWVLTKNPDLRRRRAPFSKGMVAFNVLASVAYSGAAFSRTGPPERDTRGIAEAARIDERWVGAVILAPAALDAWRYCQPDSRLAVWLSRGAKIGTLLLVFR